MKSKPQILLVGHSWVRSLAEFKDVAAENGYVFESNWWHNANLDKIVQNIETFKLIKHYHRHLLVFCLIPETWRYETLEDVEPVYDNAGVPINPYEILMPNFNFDVSIFVEKFTKFREQCLATFPKLNIVLITPPRIDIYEYNLKQINNFPPMYQEKFLSNPKYSLTKMSEYSRKIYANIMEIYNYNHGWPDKSIFRNQISAQKVKWCRKIFTKFMKQEIDTCGESGPLVDGLNPSKDLIDMFWKQMNGWLTLDQELCENPLATYFPKLKDPNSSDKPKSEAPMSTTDVNESLPSNIISSSDNEDLNIDPNQQSLPNNNSISSSDCMDLNVEPNQVLILGDSWVKFLESEPNIATENGFKLDSQWWDYASFDVIRQNVDNYLKPVHKILMISCITSEAWRYETLEDFTGNIAAHELQQGEDSYVCAGFQPNANKVLMPNFNFSISEFVNKFNEFRSHCSKISLDTHVMLLAPTIIDAYRFNVELVSKYPKSQQDIFYQNPKYAASAMAEHSRKLFEKLSLMSCRWPSSCLFRNQVTAEKIEFLKVDFIKFRKGKLDTCAAESPLIDGINPTIEVIKHFWKQMKFWYGASTKLSVVREPLPDGQGSKVLMIGDDTIRHLNFGMVSSISKLVVNFLSCGNLDQLIKLADTYMSLEVDVLLLAPFNWEFLYLANYVPYEEEPKVPLINESIEVDKLIEVVKNSTEIWKQSFPNCKVIWALPHPIDFQRHYQWKVTEYGMNWAPTPEMTYEILYMTKAFYSLILQLEKDWKQSIPEIQFINLRQCFFAEEPNLEYTFCDNNQPVFPSKSLNYNGFDPSETLCQWFKMALLDKIEEMNKAVQIEIIRENRRKQKKIQKYNRYLKKMREKEAKGSQEGTEIQNAESSTDAKDSSVANGSSNVLGQISVKNGNEISMEDSLCKLKVGSDAGSDTNLIDPLDKIKLAKREKRKRKKLRQKEKINLVSGAENSKTTNETEQETPLKPEVYLVYADGESLRMEEEPNLPKLMELPLAPPGYMTSLSVQQDLLVTSSMLNTLGETLPFLKAKPMEIVKDDHELLNNELSMLTKVVEEEFSEVSPFRILDINESSYSYKFGLFFQRSKWEDLFLIGSKEVAMDAILSAIKSMLMLKCERGVKVIMITTSMSFISEVEGYLRPLVDKNFIGINDDIPLGCPIALINTPSNLAQRFSQPKLWDLSDVSAIIIYGDDLIYSMRSTSTNELTSLIKLVYSNVHYECVNRVVISETGAKEYEQTASRILRARFAKKIEMNCPPPKDESLSLFELLAAEIEKSKREKAKEELRKQKSKKLKFNKKNKLSNLQSNNKLHQASEQMEDLSFSNSQSKYSEDICYPQYVAPDIPGDDNFSNSVTNKDVIYPINSKMDSLDLGDAEDAMFDLFLNNLGPAVKNEYLQTREKIVNSHEKLCQNFIRTPNYHKEYQTERSKFIDNYRLEFGINYNVLEMENSLTDYWKKYIAYYKAAELKNKICKLQDEYKSKYSKSKSLSNNSASVGVPHPISIESNVDKNINKSDDNLNRRLPIANESNVDKNMNKSDDNLYRKTNIEKINNENLVNSHNGELNRLKNLNKNDKIENNTTANVSSTLTTLQNRVNKSFERIFSTKSQEKQCIIKNSQEIISEHSANQKVSSSPQLIHSNNARRSISKWGNPATSIGEESLNKSDVKLINKNVTPNEPSNIMTHNYLKGNPGASKIKFTLSSKENISQSQDISKNAYQAPKSKDKATPYVPEKNFIQNKFTKSNTRNILQTNEKKNGTSFSEMEIKNLSSKENISQSQDISKNVYQAPKSKDKTTPYLPEKNLMQNKFTRSNAGNDLQTNEKKKETSFSEMEIKNMLLKEYPKQHKEAKVVASSEPLMEIATRPIVPVSDLLKSSAKKPSFGELLKILGTSGQIEELMNVVSSQNLATKNDSSMARVDISHASNAKRPYSIDEEEKLELVSNPGMQEYLRESRQLARNKNRLGDNHNDSSKKLKLDHYYAESSHQSSVEDKFKHQSKIEKKPFKINVKRNQPFKTGPVAQPFQKEKDLDLLETSLNLLEPICDVLGMIGPSLRLVISQAKSCLPNCRQAFKIFVEEESVSLVNFAINKMKSLAVGSNTNKYDQEIQLASKLLQQATIYCQQASSSIVSAPEPIKPPAVFRVDITSIAKATSGKDSVHIYEFIKNTYVYKGLAEPSVQELEEVFKAVSQVHFAMAFEK